MSNSAPSLLTFPAEDEHAHQQIELIKCLLVTVQHFFGGFRRLFRDGTDPRHPVYTS